MDARNAALQILNNVEENGAYSNLELDRLFASGKIDPKDRGLVTRLAYGVLQNRALLDQILRKYITRGFNKLKRPVVNALRLAAYQILFLSQIPDYAAVDQAVRQIKKKDQRASGMANAVLRKIIRNRDEILEEIRTCPPEVQASVPDWIAKLYRESYPEEADQIFGLLNSRPPLSIRANTLKTSRDELQKRLDEEGVSTKTSRLARDVLMIEEGTLPEGGVSALPSFKEGLFIVQDAGAALISEMLAPGKNTYVADFCAAPGGKTTHLSALMENTGRIDASDIHPSRLALIEENAKRLGCENITCTIRNAVEVPDQKEAYDAILLDVPCSGLGIIRRKPDVRYRVSPQDLKELEAIQAAILDHADETLKPDGEILYSTCTVNPDENQKQVRAFLDRHPGYVLEEERMTSPLEDADCFYMAKIRKK